MKLLIDNEMLKKSKIFSNEYLQTKLSYCLICEESLGKSPCTENLEELCIEVLCNDQPSCSELIDVICKELYDRKTL